MPDLLRLIAFDCEDLAVISAHLQDALVRVGDMAYLPRTKQFAAILARFDWLEASTCRAGIRRLERCRTGLHFERVFRVSSAGFCQNDKDTILNLLSMEFRETHLPAGEIRLYFSAGCTLRLEVECLEAELCDLGLRWKANSLPGHPIADGPEKNG
jgi:hypothetical protein